MLSVTQQQHTRERYDREHDNNSYNRQINLELKKAKVAMTSFVSTCPTRIWTLTRNTAMTILLPPDCMATVATLVARPVAGLGPCWRTSWVLEELTSMLSLAAPTLRHRWRIRKPITRSASRSYRRQIVSPTDDWWQLIEWAVLPFNDNYIIGEMLAKKCAYK